MSRRVLLPLHLLGLVAAALLTWLLIGVADDVAGGSGGLDVRPLVLCVGLVGLSVTSYAVWFSRWNVLAHTNLVFAVVAYVVPIFVLHRLDGLTSGALDTYYRVVAVGFAACLLGTLAGGALVPSGLPDRVRAWRDVDGVLGRQLERRTLLLVVGSVVLVLLCFAYLRFAPALAADPLAAKFFKGVYAARYGPVALPYRLATSIITLLLPLAAMYAVTRRAPRWWAAYLLGSGVLLLGLLRQPAVAGTLVLLGVLLASRRRGLLLYFVLLVAAYFSGAALYSLLSAVGLGGFGATDASTTSLFSQVAAGAPDMSDQLTFLQHWLAAPEYTHGRTFLGGLVPGNFVWNPSVWSLHVVNPGVSIRDIDSGGFRLPAPVWGLVSFGWPGVVGVSFLNGVATGFLARLFARIVPGSSLAAATGWTTLYVALTNVVPMFYGLAYLAVLQLVVVTVVLFAGSRARARTAGDHAAREPVPA